METFLLVLAGFIVGWKLCELFFVASLKRLLNDLDISQTQLRTLAAKYGVSLPAQSENQDDESAELEVVIEQQPEGLFAYRKQDLQFLAQGADKEELMINLVNNLPYGRVTVSKEDGADLIRNG
jgi:hypothetical protein